MALKKITESPTIGDTIDFDIICHDADGCYSADPYKVDKVVIYHIKRDFSSGNQTEYEAVHIDKDFQDRLLAAEKKACESPTAENIEAAHRMRLEIASYSKTASIYYNDAVPIAIFGTTDFPAWLSTDQDNAILTHVTEDSDGNTVYGNFKLVWQPIGQREGDYFICWTWTPQPAGDSYSAHESFMLMGNTLLTTSIPSHATPYQKYEILLERYLPEMFKVHVADSDLSPEVLDKFNQAIAKGFTMIEDMANQLVDLQDANAVSESLLLYLANFLDLKVRSEDPTRWRRQIKRAVPLYKMKGTKRGLTEALDQAGIRLVKLTRLWQVISPYTRQESFVVSEDGTTSFRLAETALDVESTNFAVWVRYKDTEEYTSVLLDDVQFDTADNGSTDLIWEGAALVEGDVVRVLYKVTEVAEQDIENYIRTLPYADQRDEVDQEYPKKNWNVRVIEEDDPLFSVIVPNRHPYADFLVFGKVRTEFPYSENTYNMETFNGSLRDSKSPCDIDKDFMDSCSQCLASVFNLDLEIERLSNDRILETIDIVKEYSPFHAIIHTLNFSGSVEDIIKPPVEEIECLVQINGSEAMIAGAAQFIFARGMENGLTTNEVKRNVLANVETVASDTGIAHNDAVVISCMDLRFDQIGLDSDTAETYLEILAPHAHAGTYEIGSPYRNYARITSAVTEPLTTSSFTFRLSNLTYTYGSASITQDNLYSFTESGVDWANLGVKTVWDIDNGSYTGNAWKVYINAYSTEYPILNVLPGGTLLLEDDGSLPNSNAASLTWTLKDGAGENVQSGTAGILKTTLRGRVSLDLDTTITDVRNAFSIGNYLWYDTNGIQYRIMDWIPDEEKRFYIAGWNQGDVGATHTIKVYHRLADNQIGNLDYIGLMLQTSTDHESGLSINNGENPPAVPLEDSRFKENFLVAIGSDYYVISAIDGTDITLAGPDQDWKTLGAGGTSVPYTIYRYVRQPKTINGHDFGQYDRRGDEIITKEIENAATFAFSVVANRSEAPANEIVDMVSQREGVSFVIDYADGSQEKGDVC